MKVLKALLRIVWRIVRGVTLMLFGLVVLGFLFYVPGCSRFERCKSHTNLHEMLATEKDEIHNVFTFEQGGSNYTVVVLGPCRMFASGPGVLVYGPDGRLVDRTRDIGDCHIEERWNFTMRDVFQKHSDGAVPADHERGTP